MMKKNNLSQLNLLVAAIFILTISWVMSNYAYAQIENFDIDPSQIKDPPKCSQVTITGDKATVPFELKVYIDFSRDANINFEQKGRTIARTFTSPELLIFEADQPDEFQVRVDAVYDTDRIRAMFIQYLTLNSPNFEEILTYEGFGFCRVWNIKTTERETLPTREELIGKTALRAFEEMPLIKDAINRNTSAQSSSIAWLFIAVVAALGVSVSQLFVYVARKRKDKQRGTAFDTMIKVGSKHIANFKKEHDEIKKIREQFTSFLDVTNVDLKSYLVDLRTANKLPVSQELELKEDLAEETSVLRKIYNSTSDEALGKLIKFLADKTSQVAKRNKDLISDELQKRKHDPKETEAEKEFDEEGQLTENEAKKIVKEYGNLRYRELSDDKLIDLYRAFDKLYRQDPKQEYSKRLNKMSEILNIRAKEKANGEKKK